MIYNICIKYKLHDYTCDDISDGWLKNMINNDS